MERPTLQGLFQLRQEEYLRVSPLALFVYDYLVTFGDEVTFVWTKPKSLGTVLYFLARYPAFVDLMLSLVTPRLPVDQCIALDHAMGWMFLIGIAVAEIIMIMRVWSLWGGTRFMTIFLSMLTIATLIAGVTVLGLSRMSLTFVSMRGIAPNMSGCYPLGSNGAMSVDYAILMGFEAITLTLTLVRCIRHSRLRSSHLINPSSLIDLFIRDGVIYFVGLFAISFINVIMLMGNSQLDAIAIQRCLHSVLASRIFIHLRRSTYTTFMPSSMTLSHEMHSDQVELRTLSFAHTACSGTVDTSQYTRCEGGG
ncbi:hypothetical protein BDN71DRAFT_191879 [Pleurotus eryngii]|uniref:DUF6533 domain-containing protein n=1 Tax=Pleurotus eryngii TaxID=5323 RepID=A0A9P5ZMV7_PLEER|nr:hypothetical protein BDN71DRAFT_191879 [Pleurotus eryngii]